MEGLDRKDIRLVSSLIDLKLDCVKTETTFEEVPFFIFRENARPGRSGHCELSTTVKSTKTSPKLSKKRQ